MISIFSLVYQKASITSLKGMALASTYQKVFFRKFPEHGQKLFTKSKNGSLFENQSFQNQPFQIARRLIFGMWTWFGPLLKIFGKKFWRQHQVPSFQFFAKQAY